VIDNNYEIIPIEFGKGPNEREMIECGFSPNYEVCGDDTRISGSKVKLKKMIGDMFVDYHILLALVSTTLDLFIFFIFSHF